MGYKDYMGDGNEYSNAGFYVPARMMNSIARWIENGVVPGGFLQAVIKNDLTNAVGRADSENMANLPAYVFFFYNVAPAGCHGSVEKLVEWSKAGGLSGVLAKEALMEEEANNS